MADNVPITAGEGTTVSTEEVSTLNALSVTAQHIQRMLAAIRTADGTAIDLPGDASNSLDVDVTRVQGTVAVSGPLTDAALRATPVPVSGAVTISDGSGPVTVDGTVSVGNLPATQPVSATALPLPTGAATDAGLAALLGELQQKLEAGDLAGLATQATLAALLTDSQAKADLAETQPVSAASLPLPSGAATAAKQDTLIAKDYATETTLASVLTELGQKLEAGGEVALAAATLAALETIELGASTLAALETISVANFPAAQPVTDNGGSLTVDGTVAATQSGTWTVQPGNTANTTAWKVDGSAVTQPVSGTVTAAAQAVSSATVAQVASSASNVTLQASNASRKGWLLFNDSTSVLYVKFGATASTSSYTVRVAAGGYYEMPVRPTYTGIIDGIWASANGNAYVTEL